MDFVTFLTLCREWNIPVVVLLLLYLSIQAVLVATMINDRKNNAKDFKTLEDKSKTEIGHVYERFKLQEKKFDRIESGLTEVAKGQIETDKKVVEVLQEVKGGKEVLREVRAARIKLEEKFKRYHGERQEGHETA